MAIAMSAGPKRFPIHRPIPSAITIQIRVITI
jgi:hypothetical protein